MMDKLVSVVVAIYNVEAYLERCINSICNQTYPKLEIILVDDGSTDASGDICDYFSKKDSRIQVIHKENGGVVSARKAGIRKAKGEYLLSVDSDDWIESNMIEELLNEAIRYDADIVTSGCFREEAGTCAKLVDGIPEGVYCEEQDAEFFYKHLLFNGSSEKVGIMSVIWNKLIKTSLFCDVYQEVEDSIIMGEDIVAAYSCCIMAKKIVVTHNIFYHYCMRPKSIVHSTDSDYFKRINDLYIVFKSFVQKSVYSEVLQKQLDMFFVKYVLFGINYWGELSKEVSIPYYDFDKNRLKKDARIVLYGAGRVGQAFYKQIQAEGNYRLVSWLDKRYSEYRTQNMPVDAPDMICNVEYDYILVGVLYEDAAEDIKAILVSDYGVNPDKVIWIKPITILDKYCNIG